MSLKKECIRDREAGCYVLTRGASVPVRTFMKPRPFEELEEEALGQAIAATRLPGVTGVVLTPDAHTGYVVPVGCVMATEGTLRQAPVGYDIGCGMALLTSDVSMEKGLDDRLRLRFSREVMERVGMGTGVGSSFEFDERQFEEIVRGGAVALGYSPDNSERDYLPVHDPLTIAETPKRRGIGRLGSLRCGNHFIELNHEQDGRLCVMVHTGSRGFGHGLASRFIEIGRELLRRKPKPGSQVQVPAEAVHFEPDNPHWHGHRIAVAAGANLAIANRLPILQELSRAFRGDFGKEPETLSEVSHNLARHEPQPDGSERWVHRKGAIRALPPGHPLPAGARWTATGHPILIPVSMGDRSFVLYAEPGAAKSLYGVNHGCGRRLSRKASRDPFTQSGVNRQMKDLNVVVKAGGDVPIDESPGCCKEALEVIDSVVAAGLARVAMGLTPIASLKGTV